MAGYRDRFIVLRDAEKAAQQADPVNYREREEAREALAMLALEALCACADKLTEKKAK